MSAPRLRSRDIRTDTLLTLMAMTSIHVGGSGWVQSWDLESFFPEFPPKVVRAKMGRLIRRGAVTGCSCGCRGDFLLTRRSIAHLERVGILGPVVAVVLRGYAER